MKLLFLLTISLLGVPLLAKSVKDHSNGIHQCEYNGKNYAAGEEIIATRRLCLNCTCTKDFIEPSDYNCSVINCKNIEPLERGCMPIYDEIECCPVNWNCTGAQPLTAQCEKRYLIHYDAKGCTPILESGSDCPTRYDCPEKIPEDNSVCLFKGRTYKEGDAVDVGNPCKICSCRKNFARKGVDIDCISVECPQAFGPALNDSCYRVYQANKCCSVKTQCTTDGDAPNKEKVCQHDGKTYHYGERIYPEEDKCQICICNEQWSGIHGNSCRTHECALELKRKQLQDGCVPIYHESTCCPIEFYCGSREEGFKNSTVFYANKEEIGALKTCNFKGTHYSLGQTLNIDHPTHCVTCTCITPPDFTCVHKTCPGPPNGDYDNCESNYKPGECCPTYDCKKLSG